MVQMNEQPNITVTVAMCGTCDSPDLQPVQLPRGSTVRAILCKFGVREAMEIVLRRGEDVSVVEPGCPLESGDVVTVKVVAFHTGGGAPSEALAKRAADVYWMKQTIRVAEIALEESEVKFLANKQEVLGMGQLLRELEALPVGDSGKGIAERARELVRQQDAHWKAAGAKAMVEVGKITLEAAAKLGLLG